MVRCWRRLHHHESRLSQQHVQVGGHNPGPHCAGNVGILSAIELKKWARLGRSRTLPGIREHSNKTADFRNSPQNAVLRAWPGVSALVAPFAVPAAHAVGTMLRRRKILPPRLSLCGKAKAKTTKSFLLLFFKKEGLAAKPLGSRQRHRCQAIARLPKGSTHDTVRKALHHTLAGGVARSG